MNDKINQKAHSPYKSQGKISKLLEKKPFLVMEMFLSNKL